MFVWFLRGGLLWATVGVVAAAEPVPNPEHTAAIRNFFSRYQCPLAAKAELFARVAAKHGLDWRLLPSLSMVESTGGKYGQRNNVFGWNSGKARFRSVDAGIEYVADRLANSPIYAGGSTRHKLARYNPARGVYPDRVIKFMRELSAEPVD